MEPLEIRCEDLHRRIEAGERIRLVDCREAWEFDLVHIEGAELLPMNQTPARLDSFREEKSPQVVYCHHGVRSLQVVSWLRQQGVEDVRSLAGGIDRWSRVVDPALPSY